MDRLEHFCAAGAECLREVWAQLGFEEELRFVCIVLREAPEGEIVRLFGTYREGSVPGALHRIAEALESPSPGTVAH